MILFTSFLTFPKSQVLRRSWARHLQHQVANRQMGLNGKKSRRRRLSHLCSSFFAPYISFISVKLSQFVVFSCICNKVCQLKMKMRYESLWKQLATHVLSSPEDTNFWNSDSTSPPTKPTLAYFILSINFSYTHVSQIDISRIFEAVLLDSNNSQQWNMKLLELSENWISS